MPKFNPSIVVTNLKGVAQQAGEITDGALRSILTEKRAEILRRSHKNATQDEAASVPQLEEEAIAWVRDNTPKLTLGDAVVGALTAALRKSFNDPNSLEDRSESDKLKHMRWAMKVMDAQEKGVDQLVEFDDDDVIKTIRDRVSRAYPDPIVIYRLDEAIRAAG